MLFQHGKCYQTVQKANKVLKYKNKSGDIVAGKKATLENYTTALRLGLMMNW